MWLMFVVVINAYPQGWLDTGFSMLGDWCSDVIEDEQLRSLVVDGVIGGVGSVLSFVPLIVLLYLFISLLEDTGYMARAAFLIDRAMRALGLHGKSFIPMILGFGCNVPGIMAARTLDNEKDRLVTVPACRSELRCPPAGIHLAHRRFLRRFRPRWYGPLRRIPFRYHHFRLRRPGPPSYDL